MSQFRLLVTQDGKHPAAKWAELAADEIIEISENEPGLLVSEAKQFRAKLVERLTGHHQHMMDHEQEFIKQGKHDVNLPYETEEHAAKVADELCRLADGTCFAAHFDSPKVRDYIEVVCNRYFKSAKLVERQYFHSENARTAVSAKPKKKASKTLGG